MYFWKPMTVTDGYMMKTNWKTQGKTNGFFGGKITHIEDDQQKNRTLL